MKNYLFLLCAIVLITDSVLAQLTVNPNGVNVNANGATTVFLSYGPASNYIPVEAFWCGELTDATPDIGNKCDQATLFGSLPIRYNLSSQNASGTFTDIMSIPPSVARRAYQQAKQGVTSSFFYVRRFVSKIGGPDEYVAVTCRLAGGGARVPLALLDVTLNSDTETAVAFVKHGETAPQIAAEIYYNGTGQLKGRWEVVLPGDEPPEARDLLTEASLPVEERGLQRRYTEVGRFSVYLPPTGKYILAGPDIKKLPTAVNGLYMILLRIEASDDKEGNSSLGAIGTGTGVIRSGGVAGFPMPAFRYYVGNSESDFLATRAGKVRLLLPESTEVLAPGDDIDFSWADVRQAALYRLEVKDSDTGDLILSAVVETGMTTYRAPSWLHERTSNGALNWRIIALNFAGNPMMESDWQVNKFLSSEGE